MPAVPSSPLAAAVLACSLAGLAGEAHASLIINIYQDGADVRSTVSGSFNTGIAPGSTGLAQNFNMLRGGNGQYNNVRFSDSNFSGNVLSNVWQGTMTSSPGGATRYGSSLMSEVSATASSVSGFQRLWVTYDTAFGPGLFLDQSYTGGAVSGSMTFAGTTMATLGFTNYGAFEYTFGSGGTTDTVTVNLLQAPPGPGPGGVPLPGAAGLAAVGLAGLSRRRRR
jgi:MYXO-CTERM domain-containing protein